MQNAISVLNERIKELNSVEQSDSFIQTRIDELEKLKVKFEEIQESWDLFEPDYFAYRGD